MDYGLPASPSQSPSQILFPAAQYLDSTSEGSSPDSPHYINQMIFNSGPVQYDMFNYGTTPSNYLPPQIDKVHAQYAGSSTLDDCDRRRRRSGSTSISSKDKETLPNMHLRRRAQNRASQRAFRERKEKHVKGLEHQLEDLYEKHQDLLQSYTRQAEEVAKLNTRIAELNAELTSLRPYSSQPHHPHSNLQDQSFSEMLMPDKFEKFDAFSAHDTLYNGSECNFDKNTVNLNSEVSVHSFEDAL